MNYIQKSLLHKISYLLLTLIPSYSQFSSGYLLWISSLSLFLVCVETKIATGTATITTTITSVTKRHMHMQAFRDNITQNFTGTRFGSAGGCSVLDVTSWIGASLLVPVKGAISLMQHFDGCSESIILGTSVDSFFLWRGSILVKLYVACHSWKNSEHRNASELSKWFRSSQCFEIFKWVNCQSWGYGRSLRLIWDFIWSV